MLLLWLGWRYVYIPVETTSRPSVFGFCKKKRMASVLAGVSKIISKKKIFYGVRSAQHV